MFSKKLSLSLAAVAASIFVASAAQASFTASFNAGTGTTSTPPSPLVSGSPVGGLLVIGPTNVTVNGTSGGSLFSISNFTATSNSPSATTDATVVGSSVYIANTSSAIAKLRIDLVDNGFTAPTGSNLQVSTLGTVTWSPTDSTDGTDVVVAKSVVNGTRYASTSDTLTGLPLSGNMPLSTAMLTTLTADPSYSFGSHITVTLNPGDSVNVNWTSQVAAVPEPTAASLMGMGGLGALLLLGGRRKIKA